VLFNFYDWHILLILHLLYLVSVHGLFFILNVPYSWISFHLYFLMNFICVTHQFLYVLLLILHLFYFISVRFVTVIFSVTHVLIHFCARKLSLPSPLPLLQHLSILCAWQFHYSSFLILHMYFFISMPVIPLSQSSLVLFQSVCAFYTHFIFCAWHFSCISFLILYASHHFWI
jgi:hypothetical protein